MKRVYFRLRRSYSSIWTEKNPVLRSGEPGLEKDTGKFKIGNGVDSWSDLPYFAPASNLASILTEGSDGGGVGMSNTGDIDTGGANIDLATGSLENAELVETVTLSLDGVPLTRAVFVANDSTVDQLRDALIEAGHMDTS